MIKQAPSVGRILTMVAFALSCFGILIFLWLSFGGSVPLQPEGYRVNVAFPEATQLAQEAEVRISGVKVGKVRKVEPNEETGLTDAVVEIDARYAPIAKDARAILRQKTLLGETYVELAPGSKLAGTRSADGGSLAARPGGRDRAARRDPPHVRPGDARALLHLARPAGPSAARGNGEAISDALGNLTPFAENTDDVLKVLRAQSGATQPAGPEHGRGLQRPLRAPGPAARADPELEPRLGGHRAPRRQARRHVPGAADLPPRGPHDHHAA